MLAVAHLAARLDPRGSTPYRIKTSGTSDGLMVPPPSGADPVAPPVLASRIRTNREQANTWEPGGKRDYQKLPYQKVHVILLFNEH